MLRITESQFINFSNEQLDAIARQLAVRAQQRHPKVYDGQTAEGICSILKPAIVFARDMGFSSAKMLARYTDLCSVLSVNFGEKETWAREILGRHDFSPETKLTLLEETAIIVQLASRI